MVLDDLQIAKALAPHQPEHRVRLADAHLKIEPAAGGKDLLPIGGNGPVEVQTVRTAIQGQMGLVIPHRRVQLLNVPCGDIGRVAEDALEVPQVRVRYAQRVHPDGYRSSGKAIAPDILTADFQGAVVELPQHHMGLRDLRRRRQTQASASRAEVQCPALPQCPEVVNGQFRQKLGIRPWNQHIRGNIQRQAVELPLANDIGHRFPFQMPLQKGLHPVLHLWGRVKIAVPHQFLTALSRGAADQLPGLQRCPVHSKLPQAPPQSQV